MVVNIVVVSSCDRRATAVQEALPPASRYPRPVFRVDRLRGADSSSAGAPGEIDYRLARQSVISEFRKGRIAQHEVCDAHPELLRAARNVGEPSSRLCPICEDANVVLVSYVFGPRMPAHGRCVTTKGEIKRLAAGADGAELACYVVEVCPSCSWNHLARTFQVAPARPRRAAPAKG